MEGKHLRLNILGSATQVSSGSARWSLIFGLLVLFLAGSALPAGSQESPYIVTYDHYLEEPGSLEVEYFSTYGTQRGGNDFHAYWTEFEYGARAWWTTELYVNSQTTRHDGSLFTGFRFENRFRLLVEPIHQRTGIEITDGAQANHARWD